MYAHGIPRNFLTNENGIWIGTTLSIILFFLRKILYQISYISKKKKKKEGSSIRLFVIYHSWVRYFPWQYFSRLTTLFGISSLCVSENCKFSSLIPLRKYCIQMKIGQSESRTLFPCILRSIFLATVDSIFHLITVETFMKRHKRKNYRLIFLSLFVSSERNCTNILFYS